MFTLKEQTNKQLCLLVVLTVNLISITDCSRSLSHKSESFEQELRKVELDFLLAEEEE